MKKVGEVPGCFYSYNTCQHKGRVLNFSLDYGILVVTEALLGEVVGLVKVRMNVSFERGELGCCSLGSQVLVISGSKRETPASGSGRYYRPASIVYNVSAALVEVGSGELSAYTVHVTKLAIEDWGKEWHGQPFLCPVFSERALLYFDNKPSLWYCDIVRDTLRMSKLSRDMPVSGGFRCVPCFLSSNKLIVAGGDPRSSDIVQISLDGRPSFEQVGYIPGKARSGASIIVLENRFVVGFGGYSGGWLFDLWILDILTHRVSPIQRRGDWHSDCQWAVLAVKNNILYILGGYSSASANSLAFVTFADLIEDSELKSAFKSTFLSTLQSRIDAFQKDLNMLRKELQSTETELRNTRRELHSTQAELARVTPPRGTLITRLRVMDIPTLCFPMKWKISCAGLKELVSGISSHRKTLPQKYPVLLEYQRIFGPFLARGLPRMLLSASASIPAAIAYNYLANQASTLVKPGELYPKNSKISILAKRHPLRQESKLFDSGTSRHAIWVYNHEISAHKDVISFLPPEYTSLLSAINSHDFLAIETAWTVSTKIKRIICVSKFILSAEEVRDIDSQILHLQNCRRLRSMGFSGREDKTPYVPWLDPNETPQGGAVPPAHADAESSQSTLSASPPLAPPSPVLSPPLVPLL